MKLLKPCWVHHDEKPIFSVDVHQECLKFATGGQGLDSGRVVIWNLLPVLSEKAEQDENVPKILCQIDSHLACVNCVRWSQNGQLLASGSDDKLVMIWRQSKGTSGVFGTGGIQKNPESWKCAATLRGHSGDVLDLAWSPQDRWLASCSIDNTIIVWDAQALPTMVAMLKGHTGLVKGITWDPVGKFLSSQSDDRTVKIWKTSDWSCSNTIAEPFEDCGGTTHVLRLSWSPDGLYLVSAHAMNSGGPTAQIIEREGWKCDKDFVGHRKAVTCVRFHTAILKRHATKTNKPQQYCCLAMGSRDRSLSVWMTALQRPLVVIHELFNDSILDLSWGPDKCILMACSGDGTVACLQFSPAELGTPLSVDEKNSLYQRIYGKSATLENGSNGTVDALIENPELLNKAAEKLKSPTLSPSNPLAVKINNNNNNNNININNHHTNYNVIEHRIGVVASDGGSTTAASSGPPLKAISKQVETRTADGKRRITPVFIPLNQNGESVPPPVPAPPVPPIETIVEPEPTFHAPPKPLITEAEQTHLDSRLTKCAAGATTLMLPMRIDRGSLTSFPTTGWNLKAPSIVPVQPHQASTAGPKLNIGVHSKCEYQKTALDFRVHVANGAVPTPGGLLARVTTYALKRNNIQWQIYVGSPIVNLNFCSRYVMLCSLDGTMRLLHMDTGSAALPVISMANAAIQCTFCPLGKLVGIITDSGLLRIWNVEQECITLASTCAEIFGKYGAVVQFTITEHGVPVVVFGNGHAYTYSARLQAWLVVTTRDPIMRHGLQTTVPIEFKKDYRLYPLVSVQATMHNFTVDANRGAASSSARNFTCSTSLDWQSSANLTFIENQIKLSEALNSPEELQHWYTMLAYQLAVSGTEHRIRHLLDDLLGPAQGSSLRATTLEERKILSVPKYKLLESVLDVLKSHIKWQRLYMEYFELHQLNVQILATPAAATRHAGVRERQMSIAMDTAA